MTLFDLIAIAVLLVSGLVGFTRGAVRELVTVFAFTLASLAALHLLPFAGPLARRFVDPPWAANLAAVAGVFLVAYIGLRIAAHLVTTHLHAQPALGALDRSIGLGFGLVRALVFLGLFYLVFNVATPPDLVPRWISDSKFYPVARAAGRVVGALAPKALKASGRLGPALERAVTEEPEPAPAEQRLLTVETRESDAPPQRSRRRNPPQPPVGYDKRSRDDIDALVERSR